jgi:hypothetical protein
MVVIDSLEALFSTHSYYRPWSTSVYQSGPLSMATSALPHHCIYKSDTTILRLASTMPRLTKFFWTPPSLDPGGSGLQAVGSRVQVLRLSPVPGTRNSAHSASPRYDRANSTLLAFLFRTTLGELLNKSMGTGVDVAYKVARLPGPTTGLIVLYQLCRLLQQGHSTSVETLMSGS